MFMIDIAKTRVPRCKTQLGVSGCLGLALCLAVGPSALLAEGSHSPHSGADHGQHSQPGDGASASSSGTTAGASCHAAPESPPKAAEVKKASSVRIPDLEVLDQDGHALRFYGDLVRGKVVAMNFVFTTCTTVCPPMGATFSRLQKLLREQGREDVVLISVSIDPAVDTPARMKAWGRKFDAGKQWTLVTGSKPRIDRLLKALGVFAVDKTEHSPVTLLGNDLTGEWKRTNGLASPSKMIQQLAALSAIERVQEAGAALGGR